MKKYDIAIIGAGSGGLVAAETAARLGASVVLVEKAQRLGGECLHFGCVPSKSLIHAARTTYNVKQQSFVAIEIGELNFSKVTAHISRAISDIEDAHDNDDHFQEQGVEVLDGDAKFISKRSLMVGDEEVQAKKIIIATGSRAFIPPIEGVDTIDYLTNETVFSLTNLPDSLVVVGGGPIGCELGQAFAMLGSRVTIIQGSDRILPREEPEASNALHDSMKEMGVEIITNATVKQFKKQDEDIQVTALCAERTKSFYASHVLLATGRRANTPEGLQVAGIKTGRGIDVNKHLQTSNKNIYAVGDCNGGLQFTHSAAEQATLALRHALYGFSRSNPDVTQTPWATFTTPEIAHIGETKQSLQEQSTHFIKLKTSYGAIDKAVAENESGYIEILVNKKGVILGATIVGHNASELINYVAFIKHHGKIQDMGKVVQAYPTLSLTLKTLAGEFAIAQATSGFKGFIVRRLKQLNL